MSWKYRDGDLLRTTTVTITINEGQWDYVEQLMAEGLWGNTIEEALGELINRGLREQLERERIRLVRCQLRRD